MLNYYYYYSGGDNSSGRITKTKTTTTKTAAAAAATTTYHLLPSIKLQFQIWVRQLLRLISYSLKIYFNIIFPFMCRPIKWCGVAM